MERVRAIPFDLVSMAANVRDLLPCSQQELLKIKAHDIWATSSLSGILTSSDAALLALTVVTINLMQRGASQFQTYREHS
jgi:hypothetical protein